MRRHDRLLENANALSAEIIALGGSTGGSSPGTGGGRGRRNDVTLEQALKRATGEKSMSVTEAGEGGAAGGLPHHVTLVSSDRERHADWRRRLRARGQGTVPGKLICAAPEHLKTLLIVFHTGGVKTEKLAEGLERGARSEAGVYVIVKRCADIEPEELQSQF